MKFDNDGNYKWHKIIGGNVDVTSLVIDNEDNVYAGGNVFSSIHIDTCLVENKAGSVYVAKFNADGTTAWLQYSEQIIPTAPGQLTDMILDSDNNPLITGAIT